MTIICSKLDALAAISETALTRDTAIEIAENGLPTTFVPGRNLVFFCFAGALAYRRGARHLVAGMCETDYSGYPDCRDDTIKAMQVALSLGLDERIIIHTPLMWIDKAETLLPWRRKSAAKHFLISSSRRAIAVTWASAAKRHDWGYGCGDLPGLSSCGRRVLRNFMSQKADMTDNDRRRVHRRHNFLVLFCLTIPAANWMIGHAGTVCVPDGPCLVPVAPGTHGAFRRADGRCGARPA